MKLEVVFVCRLISGLVSYLAYFQQLCSKTIDHDQLSSDCLCFRMCKNWVSHDMSHT